MTNDALAVLVSQDPYCAFLGIRLADDPGNTPADGAGEGWSPMAVGPDLLVLADEHHIGNRHTLGMHGGVVAAFLETAGRLHIGVATAGPVRTLTFTTEFLREVRGGELRARTEIVRRGRRLAVARITAWQDDPDRPSATGHGAFGLGGSPG